MLIHWFNKVDISQQLKVPIVDKVQIIAQFSLSNNGCVTEHFPWIQCHHKVHKLAEITSCLFKNTERLEVCYYFTIFCITKSFQVQVKTLFVDLYQFCFFTCLCCILIGCNLRVIMNIVSDEWTASGIL